MQDWLRRKRPDGQVVDGGEDLLGRTNRVLQTSLTHERDQEVARLYATGRYRQRTLVDMFGVDRATIRNIIRRHRVALSPEFIAETLGR